MKFIVALLVLFGLTVAAEAGGRERSRFRQRGFAVRAPFASVGYGASFRAERFAFRAPVYRVQTVRIAPVFAIEDDCYEPAAEIRRVRTVNLGY